MNRLRTKSSKTGIHDLTSEEKHFTTKKLFVAKQLQRRILNLRDLLIKVLYSRCHKLNLTAEQLINEEKLDTSEKLHFDRSLGWKCHRKGSEPYFPLSLATWQKGLSRVRPFGVLLPEYLKVFKVLILIFFLIKNI